MKKILLVLLCSMLLLVGCEKQEEVKNEEDITPTIINNDIQGATQIIDRTQEKVDAIVEQQKENQDQIDKIMNEN